jgi:CheY-like chemotaxis protein
MEVLFKTNSGNIKEKQIEEWLFKGKNGILIIYSIMRHKELLMLDTRHKILIVDDEPDIRETLTNYLAKQGYEVSCAANGKDALTYLAHKSVEAVLVDIIMPQMKGSELTALIKDRYPKTKVMVITAYQHEGETLENELTIDALLVKPLKPDEVYASLLKVLEKKSDTAARVLSQNRLPLRTSNNLKLLFVGISTETFEALKAHLNSLTLNGHVYELGNAPDTREFFQRTKTSPPDIIIIDTTYLNNLNPRLSALIRNTQARTLELELTSLAYTSFTQEDLIEKIRAASLRVKKLPLT